MVLAPKMNHLHCLACKGGGDALDEAPVVASRYLRLTNVFMYGSEGLGVYGLGPRQTGAVVCKYLYEYGMATSKCLAPFRFYPKDFKFAKQSCNLEFGVPNDPCY